MRRSARIQEKEECAPKGTNFSCPTCGEKFSQRYNMTRHVEEVHVKKVSYKCPLCDRSFVRLKGMQRHRTIYNHKLCNICHASFSHRDQMLEHRKNVHGEDWHFNSIKSFQCNICNKSFNREDNLNDHKKEVHDGQRFKCPKCSASFTQKVNLKKHMKAGKHKKSQHLHKCSICSTKFKRKYHLDRHIKEVHSQEMQIKCPECDQVFTREEHMRSHIRLAHSDEPTMYKCETCDKMFSHTYTLRRHVKQVHEKSCFRCQECSATYTQKYKLENHVTSGNHLVDFYCHSCKKWLAFKNISALQNHVKVRDAYPDGFKLRCSSIPREKYYYHMLGGIKERQKQIFIKWGLEGLPPYKGQCHCCKPDPEDFKRYPYAQELIPTITLPV